MTDGMIQLLVWIGGGLTASFFAHRMAIRKERNAQAWSVVSFLFPLAFIALACLPSLAKSDFVSTMPCPSCNAIVSIKAVTCPHCGHPLKRRLLSKFGRSVVQSIAGVILLVLAVGLVAQHIQNTSTTFPACDSNLAKSDVASAIANAPMGKVQGLSIINWKDESEVSSSDTEERCTGTVVLNNTEQHDATYRFYIDNNELYVEFQLVDNQDSRQDPKDFEWQFFKDLVTQSQSQDN